MKYIRKIEVVEAVQFLYKDTETKRSIQKMIGNDYKLTIQNERDVIGTPCLEIYFKKSNYLIEVANGEYLLCRHGKLSIMRKDDFLKEYERELILSDNIGNKKDSRFKRVIDNYYIDVSQLKSIGFEKEMRSQKFIVRFAFKNGTSEILSNETETTTKEVKKFIERELI